MTNHQFEFVRGRDAPRSPKSVWKAAFLALKMPRPFEEAEAAVLPEYPEKALFLQILLRIWVSRATMTNLVRLKMNVCHLVYRLEISGEKTALPASVYFS